MFAARSTPEKVITRPTCSLIKVMVDDRLGQPGFQCTYVLANKGVNNKTDRMQDKKKYASQAFSCYRFEAMEMFTVPQKLHECQKSADARGHASRQELRMSGTSLPNPVLSLANCCAFIALETEDLLSVLFRAEMWQAVQFEELAPRSHEALSEI